MRRMLWGTDGDKQRRSGLFGGLGRRREAMGQMPRRANEQRSGDRQAATPVWAPPPLADIVGNAPLYGPMAGREEAAIALRLFDLLMPARMGMRIEAVMEQLTVPGDIEGVRRVSATLRQLFSARQIAGYGTTLCLPEQVASVRQGWLIQAALAPVPRAALAAAAHREGIARLCSWTGWNMPVLFDQDMVPLQ